MSLLLLGSVIYMCFLNNKKKQEILKLKYKLKRAVKIIKAHDPNFQSVMPDGHDALSVGTTVYNQRTAPKFGGGNKSVHSVQPNTTGSVLAAIEEDVTKENLISLNGS